MEEEFAMYENSGEQGYLSMQKSDPNVVMTTKIAPPFDGLSSWFAYEELIDDWVELTELNPAKHGISLKNRLTGEANWLKSILDNDRLRDPEGGVKYFKKVLREYHVKGAEYVFLWRFLMLFKLTRGSTEFIRWIGRFEVTLKRVKEAWMDLLPTYTKTSPTYLDRVREASVETIKYITPKKTGCSIIFSMG